VTGSNGIDLADVKQYDPDHSLIESELHAIRKFPENPENRLKSDQCQS
jgi:hypothetical protein